LTLTEPTKVPEFDYDVIMKVPESYHHKTRKTLTVSRRDTKKKGNSSPENKETGNIENEGAESKTEVKEAEEEEEKKVNEEGEKKEDKKPISKRGSKKEQPKKTPSKTPTKSEKSPEKKEATPNPKKRLLPDEDLLSMKDVKSSLTKIKE
jgi:hypothetical protein